MSEFDSSSADTRRAGTGSSPAGGIDVLATDAEVDDAASLLRELDLSPGDVIDPDAGLSPFQDAAENLFLGREPRRFGLVDRGRMERDAAAVFARFSLTLAPRDNLDTLSTEQRAVFEVARASVRGSSHVTANADAWGQISTVFSDALARLAAAGTHVWVVGLTVGRFLGSARSVTAVAVDSDGARVVDVVTPGESAVRDLAALWSARLGAAAPNSAAGSGAAAAAGSDADPVEDDVPRAARPGRALLSVREWTVPALPGMSDPIADGLAFDVHAGQILGVTGPASSLAVLSLFGESLGAASAGEVNVRRAPSEDAVAVGGLSTSEAIACGLSYGTEQPVSFDVGVLGGIPTSVSGATLRRLVASGVADGRRGYRARRRGTGGLLAAAPDPREYTRVLEGWREPGPAVVILDDPLRFDRPARIAAIRELAARGAAVVVVSSRPAELVPLAHDVLVLRRGRVQERVQLRTGARTAGPGSGAPPARALESLLVACIRG